MPIDPLPVPPVFGEDDFEDKADAFLGAFPDLRAQINAAILAYGPGAPFCTAGGTPDAITLTSGISIGSLVAGQSASWVAPSDNTGPATINFDTLGAEPAVTPLNAPLPPGWINAAEIMSGTFNGTSWVVYPSQAYLDSQQPHASLFDEAVASTAAHTRIFGTAWRSYEIDIHNLIPAVAGATLNLRLGNGSAVMDAGASDYENEFNAAASTASAVVLSSTMASTAGSGWSGTIKIFGASAAGTRTKVSAAGQYRHSSTGLEPVHAVGERLASGQHQSFSLFLSSGGNFTADRITVRGVR